MNCQEGDLARIIWSRGSDDTIVRCIRLATAFECSRVEQNGNYVNGASGSVWLLDRAIPWRNGFGQVSGYHPLCPDEMLRPIRGKEGADETLEWVEVPKVNTTPVPAVQSAPIDVKGTVQ